MKNYISLYCEIINYVHSKDAFLPPFLQDNTKLMKYLIEAGGCLHPVQKGCMDEVKRPICLETGYPFVGVDVQHLLPNGTAQEIRMYKEDYRDIP